jgi:hypothetical protein
MRSQPFEPYHIQAAVDNPSAFPHHTSVSALWDTKWKRPASLGIYPFVDGKLEGFQEIFGSLIKPSGDDCSAFFFYNPDTYAAPFFQVADRLLAEAREAERTADKTRAGELYLRAVFASCSRPRHAVPSNRAERV